MKQFLIFLATVVPLVLVAQEWWFWPDYTLPQKAANYPGNRLPYPQSKSEIIKTPTAPLVFMGEEPTERIEDFVDVSALPPGAFSLEFWILNHVNQPVGALATLKPRVDAAEPQWL